MFDIYMLHITERTTNVSTGLKLKYASYLFPGQLGGDCDSNQMLCVIYQAKDWMRLSFVSLSKHRLLFWCIRGTAACVGFLKQNKTKQKNLDLSLL